MIGLYLARLSYGLEAVIDGPYSVTLYDMVDGTNVSITNKFKTQISIKKDKKTRKDIGAEISTFRGIDYSLEVENDPNGLYTIIRQTLYCKGNGYKKFDFSSGFLFNIENITEAGEEIEDVGYCIRMDGIGKYTWVMENNPSVADKTYSSYGYSAKGPNLFTDTPLKNKKDLRWMSITWDTYGIKKDEYLIGQFMIYKGYYRPAKITIDKDSLSETYAKREMIDVKGTILYNFTQSSLDVKYQLVNKQTGNIALEKTFAHFTSMVNHEFPFSEKIKPIEAGNYTLKVIGLRDGSNPIEYKTDIEILSVNSRPQIELIQKPKHKHFLPKNKVDFSAKITDLDEEDKEFDVYFMFNNKKFDQGKLKSDEELKFTFDIPEGLKEGTYPVKLVANDGFESNEKSFEIKVQDNTKLNVILEGLPGNKKFAPGDSVPFTAIIYDPDTSMDSSFVIQIFLDETEVQKITLQNNGEQLKKEFSITVPNVVESESGRVNIVVKGQTEEDETGFTFYIKSNIQEDTGNGDEEENKGNEGEKDKGEKSEENDSSKKRDGSEKALIAVLCVLIVCCIAVAAFIVFTVLTTPRTN